MLRGLGGSEMGIRGSLLSADATALQPPIRGGGVGRILYLGAASYTHLTLPTNREGEISVVAGQLKKKISCDNRLVNLHFAPQTQI